MKDDEKKERSFNREEKLDVMDVTSTEVGEDATQYGEFISSYFAWISLEDQKKKAKKMEKMDQEDNNRK